MKNRLKNIILITFLLFSGKFYSQTSDLVVTIQEGVLNNIFKALGEIKGTSTYSFMFIDGTYQWDLVNPRIKIHLGHADFESDVKVTIGSYSYLLKVSGNTEICYEPTTNLIYVEITKASFPLNILFMGKPHHLMDVDLAKYFETPFTFEGPLSMGTVMTFPMPDNTTKSVAIQPTKCGVKIAEKQIIVSANVDIVPVTPAATQKPNTDKKTNN